MFGKKTKVLICAVLVLGLAYNGLPQETAQASGNAKLKTKSFSMKVGEKKKIVIKKMNKKAVYRFASSSKAKATVSKKGVVTAKKKGKVTITVKEKYKKKTRTVGKVAVTIAPASVKPTAAPTERPNITNAPDVTQEPGETQEPLGPSSENMEPIAKYLADTNYEAPKGFDRVDASVAGTVEDITYDSTVIIEGKVVKRRAKVVLPKDYSEDKEYPVVYLNHGIGGNEGSLAGDNVQNVIWNAIAEGVAEEMIAVFPSGCANEYNGQGSYEFFSTEHYKGYNNLLNDMKECLMPYINEHYSTKTGREYTAIGGFSMGGRVTLHIGFTLQDDFRYIGAFCPAPGIFTHNDNGVNETGLFTKETFTLQDKYFTPQDENMNEPFVDTLVMIVKGGNDGVVKNFPKDYTDALTENKVPHIFYEVPGGGHDSGVYKPGMYNFFRRIFHEKK